MFLPDSLYVVRLSKQEMIGVKTLVFHVWVWNLDCRECLSVDIVRLIVWFLS